MNNILPPRVIRPAFITVLLCILLLFGLWYIRTVRQSPESRTVKPASVRKDDTVNTDRPVVHLTSMNIDELMRELARTRIPESSIPLHMNSANDSFTIPFFGVTLNEQQYNKLHEYMSTAEYLSSDDITFDNAEWRAFSYSESSDIYTIKGYACVLINPNRFRTPLTFNCARVSRLKDNTLEDVSAFMKVIFSEAGVPCEMGECQIHAVTDTIPLPRYSAELLFFDKNISNDKRYLPAVHDELSRLLSSFVSNGWSASMEDYTKTEAKWTHDLLTSQRIIAHNASYSCVYTITIAGEYGKRQMIQCSYTVDALKRSQEEIDAVLQR